MLILGSVFAAVPQRGAAEYFQSDSDIFEGLWGGLGGGRGNPGQLYTHTPPSADSEHTKGHVFNLDWCTVSNAEDSGNPD